MYTGSFSFNLIKVLTMALILAFIIFAAFADESVGSFKPGIANLNDKSIESGGYFSFNTHKWHTQQVRNHTSPVMHTIKTQGTGCRPPLPVSQNPLVNGAS